MLHSSMQEQSQHRNINNNNNSNTTTLMTSANSKNVNANAEGTKASTQPIGIRSLAASQLEQQHNGQNSRKYNNGDNDSVARGEPARSSSLNAATRAKLKETSTSTGSTNSNTMHSKEDSGIEARRRRCDSSSSGAVTQTGSRNSNRHKSSSSSAKASIGNVGSNVGAGSSTVTTKNPYNNTGDIMTAAKKQGDASSTSSHQQQPPNTASQRNLQSHQNSNTIKSRSSTNPKKNSRERSDDERLSIANDSTEGTARYRRRRSRRISKPTVNNFSSSSSSSSSSSTSSSASSTGSSCNGSCSSDDGDSSTSSGEPNLQYPGFPEVALKYLTQDTRPRNWCLTLITNPWFERISILVILLNCITLGMYQPCVDDDCEFNRCKILQIFDDIIFAFFALEMSIKMVAMGIYGKNTYMADSWNRLDFFIVFAGLLEYVMHVKNLNLTAIRTIRVLRPLRAINRIPSMRILVMLLLDTLPMLGNVLLLCFFVFFIFGIIGVQLWQGILRQRCVLELPDFIRVPLNVSYYYEFSKEQDYICSTPEDSGMHLCSDLPPYRMGPMICTEEAVPMAENLPTNTSCVDWNLYYSQCKQQGLNPFQGTISFDNIGMAWVAIFLVISLEGWTDIMYYVQDAHSFWDWIYFVLLIVIGSFFMINLCLVVIATQFSETKKREMERMRQERARYTSTSTLASSTNNSEPATCYAEIVKYIAHLWRRFKRRMLKKYRLYKYAGCSFNFIFSFLFILSYTLIFLSPTNLTPGLHYQTNKKHQVVSLV